MGFYHLQNSKVHFLVFLYNFETYFRGNIRLFLCLSLQKDLAFITVKITDKNGLMVSDANNKVNFSIEGSGEIVATDNGDPANLVSFASHERDAYNGLALVIVRAKKGSKGVFKLVVHSDGLEKAAIEIQSN